MDLKKNARVNIVITNHFLRYTYHASPTDKGLISHGEVKLPADAVKDGKITDKTAFLNTLKELVQVHGWKRKKLFFAIPDDTVVIRKQQIPLGLTKDEARGYIKTHLNKSIYLPFDNPQIAIEFLNKDEQYQHILLFAYPNEKLKAFEAAFTEAGLRPLAADLTSLSIYRYYYEMEENPADNLLGIHWNEDALTVTAFQQNKSVFSRYMKIDSEPVDKTAVESTIREYMLEINRIIDFYRYSITKGERQINQLVLTGDFAFLTSAKKLLTETVNIPIYHFKTQDVDVKYMDVFGLALKKHY